MPRNTLDPPDPKFSDDERMPQRDLDERFDPDDPKAGDGELASKVSRDPSRDVDDEELAEEDILEISEIDERGEGPDA